MEELPEQPTLSLQIPPVDAKSAPPRPRRHDEAVIMEAAKKILPKFLQWCARGDTSWKEPTEEESGEYLDEIFEAIQFDDDGFKICQDLRNYDSDSELVEIMDNASTYKSTAYRAACKAWVNGNNVQPPPLGFLCRYPKEPKWGIGEVTQNHDEGTSTVFFADKGHVKKGMGTHGSIIPWEELVGEPDQPPPLVADASNCRNFAINNGAPVPKSCETCEFTARTVTDKDTKCPFGLVYVQPPAPAPKPKVDPWIGQTPGEPAALHALRVIAHSTAPGEGYHENAYQVAIEAIYEEMGQPKPW